MTLTSRRATFAGRTGWVWFRLRKRQVEEAKCLCGRAMERGRNGRVWIQLDPSDSPDPTGSGKPNLTR